MLGGYFCLSDLVLITQSLYYNAVNARKARQSASPPPAESAAPEEEPLLRRRRRASSAGLPGSHRRNSLHQESSFDPLRRVVTGEDETPERNPWLSNALSIAAVYVVGTAGWFVSYHAGAWDGQPDQDGPATESAVATAGMVLGYASAVCYLWYAVLARATPAGPLSLSNLLSSSRSSLRTDIAPVPGSPRY